MKGSKLDPYRDEILGKYLSGTSTIALSREYSCSDVMIGLYLRKNGVAMRPGRNSRVITEQEDRQIEFWAFEGKSAYWIAQQLGLSRDPVERRIKSLGIDISHRQKRRDTPLKNRGKEIINDYISGVGCTMLSKKYGCAEVSIIKLLRKNNITVRTLEEQKYSINEDFFIKVNGEHSAYILGYAMADGYIPKDLNSFQIDSADLDILQKIKESMRYEGPITSTLPSENGKRKKTLYSFRVGRRKIVTDLIDKGCGPNKTFGAVFPTEDQVPKEFLRHYIRGYFDGDGGFNKDSKKLVYYITFIGTENFMEGIKKYVFDNIGVKFNIFKPYENCKNIRSMNFGGNLQVLRFLDWLYKDATIFMNRKLIRYMELKCLYHR